MNEPFVTIVGNVAGEPELRFAPSGVAVARFTVANTPREKSRATGEYEDGETMWVRVTAFKQLAENVAESLTKGSRVVVTGRLKQESWEDKEGQKRTSLVLLADEIGASLRWATAKINKATRGSETPRTSHSAPETDPWASAPAEEEPPF